MRNGRVLLIAMILIVAHVAVASAGEVMGKFAVTPVGGLGIPIQYLGQTDGGGSAKLGFAAGAMGEYYITENIAVGGRFVYNRFGMDFDDFSNPDDWDGNWTMLEFGVFGRYLFQIPDQPLLRPFVRAGVLMGKADQEVTAPSGTVSEGDITMSPGGEIAGGLMYDVADNVSVYGEVGWTAFATDGADVDLIVDGQTITLTNELGDEITAEFPKHVQWIGVKVGVSIFFGGTTME